MSPFDVEAELYNTLKETSTIRSQLTSKIIADLMASPCELCHQAAIALEHANLSLDVYSQQTLKAWAKAMGRSPCDS